MDELNFMLLFIKNRVVIKNIVVGIIPTRAELVNSSISLKSFVSKLSQRIDKIILIGIMAIRPPNIEYLLATSVINTIAKADVISLKSKNISLSSNNFF